MEVVTIRWSSLGVVLFDPREDGWFLPDAPEYGWSVEAARAAQMRQLPKEDTMGSNDVILIFIRSGKEI